MRRKVACFGTALALLSAAPVASAPVPTASGVSKDTIKIGLHAPMTGAVPLPNDSIQRAADLYWKWLDLQGTEINGRSVEVIVRDDDSNPTVAVDVCRDLIEKDKVFMLSGMLQPQIVGSYQAQACARLADDLGVPYESLGHTRIGLHLDNYLATSETVSDQARAMAKVFVKNLAAKQSNNAVVYVNSPIYSDAAAGFERRLENRGATLDLSRDTPKTAGATHAETVVTELSLSEIDNVLLIVSPTFVTQILEAARNHDYFPQWTTIGYTSTLSDEVLGSMCSGGASGWEGMLALSPLPAFGDREDFDPTYNLAIQAVYPEANGGDMTTWLGWAAAKQLHALLEDAGRGLTRRAFIKSAESGERHATGIIPAFSLSKNDHFGGSKSYLLEASCPDDRWFTLRRI